MPGAPPVSPSARITDAELASREALPTPGLTPRAGLASPTRSPWIVANGWRFTRHPAAKYVYDVPAGRAALAAAEAFAYGADAVLKIDPADLGTLGAMLAFLEALPAVDLPPVSDLAIVDDGSAITGEVMNLLARRNLLFQVVQAPSPRFPLNDQHRERPIPARRGRRSERLRPEDPSSAHRRAATPASLRERGRHLPAHGRCCAGEAAPDQLRRARDRGAAHPAARSVQQRRGSGRRCGPHRAGGPRRRRGATEFSVPRIATYAVIDLEAMR